MGTETREHVFGMWGGGMACDMGTYNCQHYHLYLYMVTSIRNIGTRIWGHDIEDARHDKQKKLVLLH